MYNSSNINEFKNTLALDANPYGPGGVNWYVNQNNLWVVTPHEKLELVIITRPSLSFRSVRNFIIDLTRMPALNSATGLHWQVSQATSLINIVVNMSTASGNNHQGIFMENGSGGFMGGKDVLSLALVIFESSYCKHYRSHL